MPLAALDAAENTEARFAAMTAAEVRAYELDVMRCIADFALIPPKLNTSPLPDYDYDRLDYGMTIGIERTPKGRLVGPRSKLKMLVSRPLGVKKGSRTP